MEIKKIRLGGILLPSNVLMAPLAGYTCYPFRMLAYEMGAGLCFTEMSSANALKYQDKATRRLLFTTAEEPVKAVQLLGGIPAVMEEMACGELLAGFDVIDINMGCPVPNVFKSGEGSALMLDQKRASAIIRGCKKSGKPVTVKCRTGIHENNMFTAEFARMCEASGADMITIHGRSRNMMYDGTPCYKEIAHAKAAVSIPVIANGGIYSAEDAEKMMEHTGADGIMLARYALENGVCGKRCGAGAHRRGLPKLWQQHLFRLRQTQKNGASGEGKPYPGQTGLWLHRSGTGGSAGLSGISRCKRLGEDPFSGKLGAGGAKRGNLLGRKEPTGRGADVRILAGGAFYGNQKLVIIRLPESVGWIGPMAFDACCRLRRVYWHSPVDRLEEAVFAGCPELETVENPMGGPVAWKSIGARAFFNCRSLREVCLKQVEEIGNTAFYGCGGLRRDRDGIGFSHSLRRVGERAFEGTCLLGAVGREGEGASEGTSLPVVYGNIVVSGAGCGGVPTEWR